MIKGVSMEMLKRFLEVYFCESFYFEDLDRRIQDFRNSAKQYDQKKLIAELDNIIKTNNYEKAIQYIKKYGMRKMSFKMTKIFIKFLYDKMCNTPTNIEPKDFYNIKTLIKKSGTK